MRVKFVLYPVLRQLARWRLPKLAVSLLLLSTRPIPGRARLPRQQGRTFRILALNLNKPGFLEDVEESFPLSEGFEIVRWPVYTLKAFADAFLAPSLTDKRYISNDAVIEATKREYRDFLSALWKNFCAIKSVDVVLSANFGYYAQQEFAAALEEAGTPYIVLHKENVRSAARVKFWHSVYQKRGSFPGRKIIVYNEIERDLQISSGVIDPDKVVVAGMPRLDRLHRWRRRHAGRSSGDASPQILFLAFWRKEKLTAIRSKRLANIPPDMDEQVMEEEWGDRSWNLLCEQTHGAMIQLARRHPDLRIIVKAKGQTKRLNDIRQLLHVDGEELPKNLKIIAGGDPFHLITKSRVVVGFNTTALLEALAAGKPVIMPWFAEACDSGMRDLIIDMGDAVSYAHSPEELIEMVSRQTELPDEVPADLSHIAAKTLRYWIGNDDGAAGLRVLNVVRRELAERN